MSANSKAEAVSREFIDRVRINQGKLRSDLKAQYDFIVCGSGSSGSVVAGRLAENPDVSVLLLEAGGGDDIPSVTEANQWFVNIRSERDWNFTALRNPHLNGRAVPMDMGKVLGGGSSINAMAWARGHNDWDLHPKRATKHGTTSRCWRSTAALKIGTARRTQSTAEREVRFSFNPRLIPTRSLPQWWKEHGRLGFRFLRIRTVA
jgi:choline dehydrogenase-like flavoprotein